MVIDISLSLWIVSAPFEQIELTLHTGIQSAVSFEITRCGYWELFLVHVRGKIIVLPYSRYSET